MGKYWLLSYPKEKMLISIDQKIIGGKDTTIYQNIYKDKLSLNDKIILFISKEGAVKGEVEVSSDYIYNNNIIWPDKDNKEVYPHRRKISIIHINDDNNLLNIKDFYDKLDLLEKVRKQKLNLGSTFGNLIRGATPIEITENDYNLLSNKTSFSNQKFTFRLTQDDFNSCKKDAKKNYIGPVNNKFKNELLPDLNSALKAEFKNEFFWKKERLKSPYVSRPWTTAHFYVGHVWLGLASKKYNDPKEGLQFQFGIDKDGIFSYGIWLDKVALKNNRLEITNKILSNKLDFIKMLHSFNDDYYLENIKANEITEKDLIELYQSDVFWKLIKKLEIKDAIKLDTKIVNDIVETLYVLLPLYFWLIDKPNVLLVNNINNSMYNLDLYDTNFISEVERLIELKKQIIIQGPPGTSKTHFAIELAKKIGDKFPKIIQFHPSYSYENFVEGINIQSNGQFAPVQKIFLRMCNEAELSEKPLILIIDEINRGLIGKIFGELIIGLEYREDQEIDLPYSETTIRIPNNLIIIGTMNTADRSIALVDYALRRRFFFVDMVPDQNILLGWLTKNSDLDAAGKNKIIRIFNAINNNIREDLSLGENYQIGHTYYFVKNMDAMKIQWKYAILPLLQEYLFGDKTKIEKYKNDWNSIIESEI